MVIVLHNMIVHLQSAGVLWSPPPDLTPPPSVGSPPPAQSNTGLPPVAGGATTAASTSVTPGAGASGGVSRKRQHPDSAAGEDAAGGAVNIVSGWTPLCFCPALELQWSLITKNTLGTKVWILQTHPRSLAYRTLYIFVSHL